MNVSAAVNHRAGKLWTILQFPVTRVLLGTLAILIPVAARLGAMKVWHIAPQTAVARALVLLAIVASCLMYVLYVRLIERRSVVELAPGSSAPEFSQGFLYGAVLFGGTILVLWWAGAYTVTAVNGAGALVGPLVGALSAAFIEELIFRGVLFRIVEEGLGSWLALGVSALVFGLLHALNAGATIVSSLAIVFEAGILLAAVYMYSRRLWMCIGMHCAWNFAEVGVFGAGSRSRLGGLLSARLEGSDLLTGGALGADSSMVAVVLCLAAGIVFTQLARRRGQIVRPFWRRRRTA